VPSLALGSAGVSLVDMTGAFACIADDRVHLRPWGVSAIGSGNGARMLSTIPSAAAQSLDPYQKPLADLLRQVIERGTGRAAAIGGFAAGKTGTSQDYRDAWFIGFNGPLVVGVWLGNDDNAPMKNVVGGSLPASIWKVFMTQATPLLDQGGVRVALTPARNSPNPPPDNTAALDAEATQVRPSRPAPPPMLKPAPISTIRSASPTALISLTAAGRGRFAQRAARNPRHRNRILKQSPAPAPCTGNATSRPARRPTRLSTPRIAPTSLMAADRASSAKNRRGCGNFLLSYRPPRSNKPGDKLRSVRTRIHGASPHH